jgi:hypothetical protein
MSTEDKNIDKKVDQLQDAMKQYASKDTVISIGGYSFTPAKLMIAAGIVSSTIGGLYGVFEAYKDYMSMKKRIAEYVSPDFSEYELRIIKLEENSEKVVGYTRDINTNLKSDIRRNETVLENVERSGKISQREVEKDIADIRKQLDAEIKEIRKNTDSQVREMQKQVDSTVQNVNERVNRIERETSAELRTIRREVDDKIKKALDNPLAN